MLRGPLLSKFNVVSQTDVFADRIDCLLARPSPATDPDRELLPPDVAALDVCGRAAGPPVNIGLIYFNNAQEGGGVLGILRTLVKQQKQLLDQTPKLDGAGNVVTDALIDQPVFREALNRQKSRGDWCVYPTLTLTQPLAPTPTPTRTGQRVPELQRTPRGCATIPPLDSLWYFPFGVFPLLLRALCSASSLRQGGWHGIQVGGAGEREADVRGGEVAAPSSGLRGGRAGGARGVGDGVHDAGERGGCGRDVRRCPRLVVWPRLPQRGAPPPSLQRFSPFISKSSPTFARTMPSRLRKASRSPC